MKLAVPYFRSFPKDFKKEIVANVITIARKGKNLQLVGLKGSGKSLLFRSISLNPKILDDFNIYQIDLNLIPERSIIAVSKLILEKVLQKENEIGSSNKKTIIFLDSFEGITDILDYSLIRVLKGVSDRFRDYVSFIFSIEKPIEDSNAFWGEVVYMDPLTRSDFDWFWKGLGGKEKFREKIYQASGGFMALIKRLSEIASSKGDLDAVIENPRLNHHILYQLELMKEGLNGKSNYFEVPIFTNFMKGVSFGKELTKLEFKVLNFLTKNKGKIVDRASLIKAVWGEYASEDVADHALDQLIHRLNKKLKGSNSPVIETIRGRGHRLLKY